MENRKFMIRFPGFCLRWERPPRERMTAEQRFYIAVALIGATVFIAFFMIVAR